MSKMKEHLIKNTVESSVVLMNQGLRFHFYDIQNAITASESLSDNFMSDEWKTYDSMQSLTSKIVEGID